MSRFGWLKRMFGAKPNEMTDVQPEADSDEGKEKSCIKKFALKEFISGVTAQLREARVPEDKAFMQLEEVVLDASFGLEVEANGKVAVYVAELGTKATGRQTQNISLKFTPLGEPKPTLIFPNTPPVAPFAGAVSSGAAGGFQHPTPGTTYFTGGRPLITTIGGETFFVVDGEFVPVAPLLKRNNATKSDAEPAT